MAGIGFQLRRMLARDSYTGTLGALGYAGFVSSGPWVFSIAGVIAIAVLARHAAPPEHVTQFLVSVTYLMAGSALLTGPLQLLFSRFVADRIYEGRLDHIVPDSLGALALTTAVSGALASPLVFWTFPGTLTFRTLLVANFVVLCDVWILTVLLSGIRAHRAVVAVYLAAYLASVAAAYTLRRWGLDGLLASLLVGQAGAMFAALALAVRALPSDGSVRFEFLDPARAHFDLAAVGLVFHVGIWADKALFWMDPGTSTAVIGPLRSSLIYDLPIFIAYLSVIPAMAVLYLRLEADFADRCRAFFGAVCGGAPLHTILRLKDRMVSCVRQGLLEIVKVQAFTLAVVLAAGPAILRAAGASPLHLDALLVDAVGVALQVLFLTALNVLFYLDERRAALGLCALFAGANIVLTLATQRMGPDWYGFGFAGAALVAAAGGLALLSSKLMRLERDTFMRQPLWPAPTGRARVRRASPGPDRSPMPRATEGARMRLRL